MSSLQTVDTANRQMAAVTTFRRALRAAEYQFELSMDSLNGYEAAEPVAVAEAPKRRGGRPKAATVAVAEAPKRRGRPPKVAPVVAVEPVAVAEAPKRRGRQPTAAAVEGNGRTFERPERVPSTLKVFVRAANGGPRAGTYHAVKGTCGLGERIPPSDREGMTETAALGLGANPCKRCTGLRGEQVAAAEDAKPRARAKVKN